MSKKKTQPLHPTSPLDRILSLDVLRGVAVLGILIMNIQSFAMIEAAYINPTAYGDLSGLNKWVWMVSHLVADQKFMTIFAMLFGAGIVLMSSRIEARGQRVAGLHYRRMFWLLVIGLAHAYLLWHGDILVPYALCGLLVFLLRKMSPRKLLILGILVVGISSVLYLMMGLSLPNWPSETYEVMMASWQPSAEKVAHEVQAYQGGWLDQMAHRIPSAFGFHTFIFLMFLGWRAGGLMLAGMACYKWGILTVQRSRRFYRIACGIGFGIGFPVVSYGIVRHFAAGWSLDYSMFLGWQFNYWGSLFVAFGYISSIMLLCMSPKSATLMRLFAPVGRMAFSNYLLQTFICTFIFYGHGLGLFGKVTRVQQVLIMFVVWLLQLVLSPIWLRHFRFGPAEWLWRSLTYWKLQPMRRELRVEEPAMQRIITE